MRPTITRFIHLRYPHGAASYAAKGGLTIAYQVADDEGHRDVVYAAAKCHINDQFCKRVGRDKAAGRLKSKEFSKYGGHLRLEASTTLKQVRDSVLEDAASKWPMTALFPPKVCCSVTQ